MDFQSPRFQIKLSWSCTLSVMTVLQTWQTEKWNISWSTPLTKTVIPLTYRRIRIIFDDIVVATANFFRHSDPHPSNGIAMNSHNCKLLWLTLWKVGIWRLSNFWFDRAFAHNTTLQRNCYLYNGTLYVLVAILNESSQQLFILYGSADCLGARYKSNNAFRNFFHLPFSSH